MQVDLSPDLVAFIAENSGPGTPFSSAEEFIAAVLQEKREMLDPLRKMEFAANLKRDIYDDCLLRDGFGYTGWECDRITPSRN